MSRWNPANQEFVFLIADIVSVLLHIRKVVLQLLPQTVNFLPQYLNLRALLRDLA
jgi:hypothetical protein